MVRKRERYSRSDVPVASKKRSVIAVFVLVGIVALLGGIVWFLWQRANDDSVLGDRELASSLASTSNVEPISGTTASEDTFTNILVFLVDDVSSEHPTLTGATLMCLNRSQNSATLVSLPLSMQVEDDKTLADAFSEQGASACIGLTSQATNMSFEHVVVIDNQGWSQLEELSNAGGNDLVSKVSDLLGYMKTDMDSSDLLELAETVHSIDLSSAQRIDAPVTQQDSWTVVDATELGLEVGTLAEEQS